MTTSGRNAKAGKKAGLWCQCVQQLGYGYPPTGGEVLTGAEESGCVIFLEVWGSWPWIAWEQFHLPEPQLYQYSGINCLLLDS